MLAVDPTDKILVTLQENTRFLKKKRHWAYGGEIFKNDADKSAKTTRELVSQWIWMGN